MKKSLLPIVSLIMSIAFWGCSNCEESLFEKLGPVESSIRNASEAVYGRYADQIPLSFNADSLMQLLRSEHPHDFSVLQEFELNLESKQTHYFLSLTGKHMFFMYDFSCTPFVDGPVYRSKNAPKTPVDPCEGKQ